MGTGFKADPDRLHFLALFLAAAGFLFLPLFLIDILAVVHDLGDRRLDIRADFDKIKILLFGEAQSILSAHGPELLAVLVNDLDFSGPYLVVGAELLYQTLYIETDDLL